MSDDHRLVIVDGGSGAVLRTIALAPMDDMAVDGTLNHAFVLSMEPTGVTPSDAWSWLPAGLRRHLPFLSSGTQGTISPGSVTTVDLSPS